LVQFGAGKRRTSFLISSIAFKGDFSMTKQLALGALLGSIVLFIWSALAWMIIPWPGDPLRSFTNPDAVEQAIKANVPQSGIYMLPNEVKRTPGMTDEQYKKASDDAMKRMIQGPMIFASVRLEPMGSMGRYLAIGFITQFVTALLATFLLLQTCGLSYKGRVVFVALIGVIIFVGGHVDEWNWWSFSNAYMCMQLGALVIGWLLAAFMISAVVRGKPA
jgi:hypothetical protein